MTRPLRRFLSFALRSPSGGATRPVIDRPGTTGGTK